MVNVPLLRKEIEFAKNHPEEHNQEIWVSDCGTYGCLAGNTVIHAGYKPVNGGLGFDHVYTSVELNKEKITELGIKHEIYPFQTDGDTTRVPIPVVARALLDLRSKEASELFEPSNKIEDIERIFTEITGETL